MSYRLGSFNMMNLSRYTERDCKKIADIILSEQFDIVAMQEVLSEGKAVEERIIKALGNDWDYTFIKADSEYDKREEGYAFVWNKDKFELANGKEISSKTNASQSFFRGENPQIVIHNSKEMIRKPCYARFIPKDSFCEIRIICVHLYYGSSTGAIDIQKRKNEFEILTNYIYPQIADKRYGNFRPAYTIMLGDYNLNIKNGINNYPFLTSIVEIDDNGRYKSIVTVQDEKTSLSTKSSFQEDDDNENKYANNYDHFTYDNERFSGIRKEVSKIDAIPKYYENDFEKYRKDVSDHVPIKLEISLRGE